MSQANIDTSKKYVKMKQDVYEHLAKTFIDKKKKQRFNKQDLFKYFVFSVIIFLVITYIITTFVLKKDFFPKWLYVIQSNCPVIIDYDFNALGNTRIKSLSFNLNDIDLSKFNYLELSIRTGNKTDIGTSLKVQIENSLLEKDAEYVSDINSKWENFSLPLEKFELVKDWSSVKFLTFTVEDWNTANKKDKIYVDDVRFVKK